MTDAELPDGGARGRRCQELAALVERELDGDQLGRIDHVSSPYYAPRRVMNGSRDRLVVVALVPSAVLVAVALIALRLHFQPPTIPAYRASGDDGREHTLTPGARFELELRPSAPVEGAVGARSFLLGPGPGEAGEGDAGEARERWVRVRPWDPPVSVARDGTVRIEGPVDRLFAGVPPGTWDVAVAVGRPEVLPTAPRDVVAERGRERGADAAWRLVVERVRLTAPADMPAP